MKCRDCKHKMNIGNTEETGSAICSYSTMHKMIHLDDPCHFLQETAQLTCGDCDCLHTDMGCFGCSPEDSPYFGGKLCDGYTDKKELEFYKILMFWKTHHYFDRDRIIGIIDDFEEEYERLREQIEGDD